MLRPHRDARSCRTRWAMGETGETVEAELQRRVRTLPLCSGGSGISDEPGLLYGGRLGQRLMVHDGIVVRRWVCGVFVADKTVSGADGFHAQISRMTLHALVAQAPPSRCVLFQSPPTTAHLSKKSRTNDEAKSRRCLSVTEKSSRCPFRRPDWPRISLMQAACGRLVSHIGTPGKHRISGLVAVRPHPASYRLKQLSNGNSRTRARFYHDSRGSLATGITLPAPRTRRGSRGGRGTVWLPEHPAATIVASLPHAFKTTQPQQ